MKKADLIVSLPAVPPLLTKWWWLLFSRWLGLWWWWFVLWFHYRCFEKEARQMRKITHMYMYSMAYMMFTLSMKLVMRPKKTRIATWTRLQPAQWGTFSNDPSLGKIWFQLLPQALGSQGCINCGILVSGIRARGVSSEHMENMEMFSCSPT